MKNSSNYKISFLPNIFETVLNSNKLYRKLVLIILDILSIYFSLELTSSLYNYKYSNYFYYFLLISLPIYLFTKQYKPLTRFIGSYSFYHILLRNITIGFTALIYLFLINENSIKFKYCILFTLIVFVTQSTYRILIRDILNFLIENFNKKNIINKIAIYKADHLGVELSNILKIEKANSVVCFIDDNPSLHGSSINGIPIISLNKFNLNIKIDRVILVSEGISFGKLKMINKFFKDLNIELVELNPLKQFDHNGSRQNHLKEFSSNNLLNRDKVKPIDNLFKNSISSNTCACITGAGGSIGSELSRQILSMNPKKLVLIDFCEYNLYKIYEELKEYNTEKIELSAKLINSENQEKLEKIFQDFKINLLFHAAAYKHVPLVEINKIEGIRNNIISTRSVSLAAINSNVNKVVLISSDKAVRPTNIMGSTKLFSELILKELSKIKKNKTIFSVVRFGNVIDSSGSVIPLFRKQIQNGGPITITHPEMERYFMTIAEAVQLVLQASVIMEGGETYLLNMGKRIKIIDLAKNMIKASGLEVKNNKNKNGDIEIKITGKRPGEKIKEDLIINGFAEKTRHPLINIAHEEIDIPINFMAKIDKIFSDIQNNNEDETLNRFNSLFKEIKY